MQNAEIGLFRGISDASVCEMEACGMLRRAHCASGRLLFGTGDTPHEIGIVLSGGVLIEWNDFWGNRRILGHVGPGEAFAETYALCETPLMVNVVASGACELLFLDIRQALREENAGRAWYPRLVHNLALLSARKNLKLSERILCTGAKSIRGRLLTYLSGEARRNRSMEFTVPFDRQQLADYLNVERTALSKELGKMRDEGMLSFHKNLFTLYRTDQSTDNR